MTQSRTNSHSSVSPTNFLALIQRIKLVKVGHRERWKGEGKRRGERWRMDKEGRGISFDSSEG